MEIDTKSKKKYNLKKNEKKTFMNAGAEQALHGGGLAHEHAREFMPICSFEEIYINGTSS